MTGKSQSGKNTAIKTKINKLGMRGVEITTINGDKEFINITESMRPINVEIAEQGKNSALT